MTSPNDEGIYLLDFQAWTGSLFPDTIRVGTHDYVTSPSDSPANTTYEGRLMNAGTLKLSMFENGGTIGKPGIAQGYFEVSNADGGVDAWLDYGIGGWSFSLYYLASKDADYSTKTLVFKGALRGFQSDDLRTSIKLRIRDIIETLDRPFLTEKYGGSTNSSGATADGDTTMLGTFKPYCIGHSTQTPAVLANGPDLIYQASIRPNTNFVRPSDGALVLTGAGTLTYPTLAALQAATTGIFGSGADIEAGEYAVCLDNTTGGDHGCYVRLGAKPAKVVTLEQWTAPDSNDISAAAVALQILLDAGVSSSDIDEDSFDALNVNSDDYMVNVYVDDNTTVLDLVCNVLNSISATIIGTAEGKIAAVSLGKVPEGFSPTPIFEEETVSDTFTNVDLSSDSQFSLQASPDAEGDGVPAYDVTVKCTRKYQTLGVGDLNGSVTNPALIGFYGREWDTGAEAADLLIRDREQPLARSLVFESMLADQTGAIIQAQRRFDFYGKRRDYLTFSVPMSRGLARKLGDIVVVKPTNAAGNTRYGYGDDGKRMCLIGVLYDFGKRRMTFTAWG